MAKYGGLLDLQGVERHGVASHTWRSIRQGWLHIKSGIRWQVGDGNSAMFWTDNWVDGVYPLLVCTECPL